MSAYHFHAAKHSQHPRAEKPETSRTQRKPRFSGPFLGARFTALAAVSCRPLAPSLHCIPIPESHAVKGEAKRNREIEAAEYDADKGDSDPST